MVSITFLLFPGLGMALLGCKTVAESNFVVIMPLILLQLMVKTQDDQLDKIGSSVRVLKDMSHQIGNELDEQSV